MSYAKSKGTKYESDIVKYLTDNGFTTVRRVPLSGAAGDKGDLWIGENPTIPNIVIECKNYAKTLTYKQVEDFVQEAYTEYKNATKSSDVDNYSALLCVKILNLGTADSWLIWKNKNNITIRCRLGDIISKIPVCASESERIAELHKLLKE